MILLTDSIEREGGRVKYSLIRNDWWEGEGERKAQ